MKKNEAENFFHVIKEKIMPTLLNSLLHPVAPIVMWKDEILTFCKLQM